MGLNALLKEILDVLGASDGRTGSGGIMTVPSPLAMGLPGVTVERRRPAVEGVPS